MNKHHTSHLTGFIVGYPTKNGRIYPESALDLIKEQIATGQSFLVLGGCGHDLDIEVDKIVGVVKDIIPTDKGFSVEWDSVIDTPSGKIVEGFGFSDDLFSITTNFLANLEKVADGVWEVIDACFVGFDMYSKKAEPTNDDIQVNETA